MTFQEIKNRSFYIAQNDDAKNMVKELKGSERKLLNKILKGKCKMDETDVVIASLNWKLGSIEKGDHISTRRKSFSASCSRAFKNKLGLRLSSSYILKQIMKKTQNPIYSS